MNNNFSDLSVVIVTYKTNLNILEKSLSSIDPSVKIIIIEKGEVNNINKLEANTEKLPIITLKDVAPPHPSRRTPQRHSPP